MLEVIAQLEARYSLVIIDAPPITVVPDADTDRTAASAAS